LRRREAFAAFSSQLLQGSLEVANAARVTSILSRPRTITGHISPLERGGDPMPFFDLMREAQGVALRMDEDDGQWWLCVFKSASGEAMNYGGIHPAGPQPKKQ